VPRAITLLNVSGDLPGEWAPSFETKMTTAPHAMFSDFFETYQQATQDVDVLSAAAASQQRLRAADGSGDVLLTTSEALPVHEFERLRLAAPPTESHPVPLSASETLLQQKPPAPVVRADAQGFRNWCNEATTGYWSKTHVDEATDDADETTEEAGYKYMTRAVDGSDIPLPGPSKDPHRAVRLGRGLKESFMPAAFITMFRTPLAQPVPYFRSWLQNCYLRYMGVCMGVDYGSIIDAMKQQLAHMQRVTNDTKCTFSHIVVADRTRATTANGVSRLCADNYLVKLIVDDVLNFMRRQNAHAEKPVDGAQLRLQRDIVKDKVTLTDSARKALEVTAQKLAPTREGAAAAGSASSDVIAVDADLFTQLTDAQRAIVCKTALKQIEGLAQQLLADIKNASKPRREQVRVYAYELLTEAAKFRDVNALYTFLVDRVNALQNERVQVLNQLFQIGHASAWIEGDRVLMFINYETVMSFCIHVVNYVRWWTHCADLSDGASVVFRWADANISLKDKYHQLAGRVIEKVDLLRTRGAEMDVRGVLTALSSPAHPDHRWVMLAIESLSDEDRAWFTVKTVASTWKVDYAPIYKHIIVHKAERLIEAPATEDDALVAEFGAEKVQRAKDQQPNAWLLFDIRTKRIILSNP
jgi:hypothetical protein